MRSALEGFPLAVFVVLALLVVCLLVRGLVDFDFAFAGPTLLRRAFSSGSEASASANTRLLWGGRAEVDADDAPGRARLGASYPPAAS